MGTGSDWSVTHALERGVTRVRSGLDSVAELCRRHGISRKTGYKWIRRYEEAGPAGLAERSCRPKTASELTAPHVVEALLETRERHPTWGARLPGCQPRARPTTS